MTHPERDEELLKLVNYWLVEVSFGAYGREDLPKLADKMLKDFAAHTAKEVVAARIDELKQLLNMQLDKSDFDFNSKGYIPNWEDGNFGSIARRRIEYLAAQLQANNKGELENE